MDILDVMLAKAMTPQGKTDAYVAKANRAAQKAAQAQQDAEAAIATVTAAAETISETQESIAELLADAQEALETAQQAQINVPELYSTTGQNTDGSMTQKAVTDALAQKADKSYVDTQIAAIPSGSGSSSGVSISFSQEDAGYLTKVGDEGNLTVSNIKEDTLIDALVRAGTYTARNAVGLDIDYTNRTCTRTQMAADSNFSFNSLPMYGKRKRCNVLDDGTITAFEGDNNYTIDGSNGQVMVYQPKFYYKRVPLTLENSNYGTIMRHEQLILAADEQPGFKLAPIFGDDLDYVLFPAFEGSLVNNKLASIANKTPVVDITIAQAEAYANARGEGWHITNMAAESANQMLFIVEYGTLNSQVALGTGISNFAEMHNTNSSYAITYRGIENPWGNRWTMIGGTNILGDGQSRGGAIYICTDFNYTPADISENYEAVGFTLPSSSGWLNAMGYGNNKYDWVYMPIECSPYANSLVPIGDNLWTVSNTTQNRIVALGGYYSMQEYNGIFYYACDRTAEESARANYGANLMFIPTKNQIYANNLVKAGG